MREHIRTLVKGLAPHDDMEQAHRGEVLRWIDSGAGLFRIEKPATPLRHMVSYFVVVDVDARKVLLVDHKKALLWLPSGGHVEPDEDPFDTVVRECREELGIEAEPLLDGPLFVTVTETVGLVPGHEDVSLWYVLRGDASADYTYDAEEFNSVRWFGFEEVPFERADPHMRRFMEKLEKELENA